jgi:hypothetical protein
VVPYPIEGTGRRTSEEGAEMRGKVIDTNMFILHVSPLSYVSKTTRSNAGHKLKGVSGRVGGPICGPPFLQHQSI